MLLCSCLDFYTRDCGPWLWTKHLGLVCHCSRENKFKWGECKTKCWGNRDQVNRFILHFWCPTLCLVSFQWSNKGAVYMIPEWLSFWNNWVYSISSYFFASVCLISRQNFVPIQVTAVFILNEILVLVRNFIVVSCKLKKNLVPYWKLQIVLSRASGACHDANVIWRKNHTWENAWCWAVRFYVNAKFNS